MNVLSLFDGMGCGRIALQELGYPVDVYYASEVDKYAIEQTKHNFPDIIHLGDVRSVKVDELKPIDLLIGGSPCQSFSFAGKRKGMSTSCNEEIYTLERYLELKEEGFEFEGQSYLFWEYMRILNDIRKYNPDVLFLLENVEMGKKWERVLSEAIGVFGVHINSALVSAQNRKRIYWTNIKTREEGFFGELYSDIPQPDDRGILLKDILQSESEVDEKFYIKEPKIGFEGMNVNSKGNTLRTGGSRSQCKNHNYDIIKLDKGLNKKHDQDKASCCKAGGNSGGNHSDMDIICVAMRGRNPENPSDRTTGSPTEQRLEPKTDGKTNCLTSVSKDNLVMQINPSKESGGKQPYQHNRVYDKEGISPALNTDKRSPLIIPEATKKGYVEINQGECVDLENISSATRRGRRMVEKSNSLMAQNQSFAKYTEDFRLRRLTPLECSRLQTVPEWYRWECSATQQYKMLGNGWTIEVIKHILSFMK